jgi:hypothetical protein
VFTIFTESGEKPRLPTSTSSGEPCPRGSAKDYLNDPEASARPYLAVGLEGLQGTPPDQFLADHGFRHRRHRFRRVGPDPQGEMFGFPKLRVLVADHGEEHSLEGLLLKELYSFVGEGWEQEDDITLLTLRRSASRN